MRHQRFVLEAIIESVAFLEAAINEIFQDSGDAHSSYIEGLSEPCRKAMAAVWTATGEGFIETLDKYDLALRLAGHKPFDRASAPYQNVRILIRLRNHLIHYKPQYVSADTPHKLGKALNGKFPANRLMAGSGNPWFPDHALGAGCADWAWRSARYLSDAFATRIGLTLHYQQADYGDPLPP
jgi:hypothetical protein